MSSISASSVCRILGQLGDNGLALPLAPLEFGPDGPILAPLRESISFAFVFAGVPFEARGRLCKGGDMALELGGDVSHVPYSAESRQERQRVQDLVAAASRLSAGGFRLTVSQRIRLEGHLTVNPPITPAAIITALMGFLLEAKPYLDQLIVPLQSSEASRQAVA